MLLLIRQPLRLLTAPPKTTIVLVPESTEAFGPCMERIHRYTDAPYRLVMVTHADQQEAARQWVESTTRIVTRNTGESRRAAISRVLTMFPDDQTAILEGNPLVPPHWLLHLTARLQMLPTIAAVVPITDDGIGTQAITRYLDAEIVAQLSPEDRQALLENRYAGNTLLSYHVSLSCVLFPARTLERLGTPDAAYLGIGRDLDYGVRSHAHGLRLAVAQDIYVAGTLTSDVDLSSDTRHADSQRLRERLTEVYGPEIVPSCGTIWGESRLAPLGLQCSTRGGHAGCPYAAATARAGTDTE